MALADRAPRGPRILTIDLERTPGTVELDVWEPRDFKRINYVHPDRWSELPATLCYSWKWYGERGTQFASTWDGDDLAAISWDLFNEADAVVTYNGKRADEKWLKSDWVMAGYGPPSPWKSVDLFVTARREFSFESKSLAHLCSRLGIENKSGHYSIADARAALDGDLKAQSRMRRYNKRDVTVTEGLADRLGPWLREWPNVGVYTGQERCCWRCGSEDFKQDGFTATALTMYALMYCDCGAWTRLNHRKHSVSTRVAR